MIEWLEGWGATLGLNPWTVKVFLVVLAALVIDFVYRKFINRVAKLAELTENLWDDALVYAGKRPFSLLIYGQGLIISAKILQPHTEALVFSEEIMSLSQQLLFVATVTWFAFRLVKGFELAWMHRCKFKNEDFDVTTVNALGRIVRIAVVITTVLTILSILEIPISGLLAAGGVGGIAIGLAARDLLANFFGGFTIFMDRPFSVGDWVRSPDRDIEGVVERIGWRITTIMKFDRRPMYVPNAVFTTITVENPSRMTFRRIFEHVGVRYDDFDKVRAIVDDIRDMLKNHEDIAANETLIVHFNHFNQSSLDIMVYCFTKTTVWLEYHRVREDVLLRIGSIIEQHDAQIAFPTRTLKVDSLPPDVLDALPADVLQADNSESAGSESSK